MKDVNEEAIEKRYILQPYPISAIQADLTTQQIRILVAMMKSIQDGVHNMFEKGPVNGQMILFPDIQEEYLNIDFKFSDVADRPDLYRDVQRLADKFMKIVLRYEDKKKGYVVLSHFVEHVMYPKRGGKRDKIRFQFTREQARTIFNFNMYSRYLMQVAMSSKSKHTARIYMLITTARGFETSKSGIYHYYVKYDELRRILGCDEKDDNDKWYRKNQKIYRQFKANILRTAEGEMKNLFDTCKSDCWFEFKELPEGFVKEPKSIDFIVHTNKCYMIDEENAESNCINEKRDSCMQEW